MTDNEIEEIPLPEEESEGTDIDMKEMQEMQKSEQGSNKVAFSKFF